MSLNCLLRKEDIHRWSFENDHVLPPLDHGVIFMNFMKTENLFLKVYIIYN